MTKGFVYVVVNQNTYWNELYTRVFTTMEKAKAWIEAEEMSVIQKEGKTLDDYHDSSECSDYDFYGRYYTIHKDTLD